MKPLLRAWSPVVFVGTLVACASSLPPAQPATSLESIAGTWQGSVTDDRGQPVYPATLVIKKDGSWEQVVKGLPGSPFGGHVSIVGGRFRWTNPTTGNKGYWDLHEGNGKRVLTSTGDGMAAKAEYDPAR